MNPLIQRLCIGLAVAGITGALHNSFFPGGYYDHYMWDIKPNTYWIAACSGALAFFLTPIKRKKD